MKYIVSRKSDRYGLNPPCAGAVKEMFIESGARSDKWVIEIPDIPEFIKHQGNCVFSFNDILGIPEVEIYDQNGPRELRPS